MTVTPTYATTDIHGNELSDEELEWARDTDNFVSMDEPVLKSNWKSAEGRDKWQDALRKARKAKSLAEWRSVMDDRSDRKAAIIHVSHNNREKWLKRVGEHNLVYRDIRHTAPYNGFSHRHLPVDENNPKRVTYATIAENEDVADKMVEAETEMDGFERHDVIGGFLNFPSCCREHFYEQFVEERRTDPMYEIACNSDSAEPIDGDPESVRVTDPSPFNNILYRYYGTSFLTHLPCKFDCDESVDVAKTRGEIMSDNGFRETANDLYEWLWQPMEWSGKSGLAHIRNEHFIGQVQSTCYWSEKRIVWGEEHESGGSIV